MTNNPRLPVKPTPEELKEIGSMMLHALDEWQDEHRFIFKKNLMASDFKPYADFHYIADWFLDENENFLYCTFSRSEFLLFDLIIEFKQIKGKWKAMKPQIRKSWH